jgi:phospholipid/cholesterol/gamma-HCH transport system substrate-binding protein
MPSPERVRWAKFRVACLCVSALSILMVLFYLLSGGMLFEEKASLYLYVSDATGIGKDSPVRVNGIDVGKVTAVDLTGSSDPNRIVRITITLEHSRLGSIPIDSTAQLSADTIVGDRFVDISTGRSPDHIQANGEVRFQPSTDLFKTIDIPQLETQLRTVDELLAKIEQGEGTVGKLVATDEIYNKLRDRIGSIDTAVRAATDNTRAVGQALYTDQLYQQIRAPIVEIDRALAQLQSGQGTGGQLLRDQAAYDQVRDSVQSMGKAFADLRAGELFQSDRLYEQWNRSIVGLIQQVNDMNANPLFATSEVYDNLNGFAREMRDSVKDFRENPRKYLRLRLF